MRLAILTFAFLAGIGVAVGHVWRDAPQPHVDDRGASIRIKL
jgi:hypothetical protein